MKACFERKKKTGKRFTLSFKSKKELVQTIKLEDTMIKTNGLFVKWKINNKYLLYEKVIMIVSKYSQILHDPKLLMLSYLKY